MDYYPRTNLGSVIFWHFLDTENKWSELSIAMYWILFVGTVHWGGIQHFDSCVPGDYGLLHSTSFHLNSAKKKRWIWLATLNFPFLHRLPHKWDGSSWSPIRYGQICKAWRRNMPGNPRGNPRATATPTLQAGAPYGCSINFCWNGKWHEMGMLQDDLFWFVHI